LLPYWLLGWFIDSIRRTPPLNPDMDPMSDHDAILRTPRTGGICILISVIYGVVGYGAGNTNQGQSPDPHMAAQSKADSTLAASSETR
jgi:UDP-N-acetylmuramyl pentapeptide phosphotransferase/UDP-N-acetylglucosamine-1-phosphate transferase